MVNYRRTFILILEYFIHQACRESSDLYFRAKILSGLLLTFSLSTAGYIIYLVLFTTLSSGLTLRLISTLLLMLGCYVFSLVYLRREGRFYLVAQLLVLSMVISIMGVVGVTGGPVGSPVSYLLVMPALVAFCLVGCRVGLFWANAVFLSCYSLLLLEYFGVNFPNVSVQVGNQTDGIMSWTLSYVAIIGVVMLYETINVKLKCERDLARDRLRDVATYDTLTGLANCGEFDERLKRACFRADRHGGLVGLLRIELDGSEARNDQHGHGVSDIVLQRVAECLQVSIRKIDTLARLNERQFGVILEQLHDPKGAVLVADKLCSRVSETLFENEQFGTVDGRIGIALYPTQAMQFHALIKYSGHALGQAKKQGRGWVLYDAGFAEPCA